MSRGCKYCENGYRWVCSEEDIMRDRCWCSPNLPEDSRTFRIKDGKIMISEKPLIMRKGTGIAYGWKLKTEKDKKEFIEAYKRIGYKRSV